MSSVTANIVNNTNSAVVATAGNASHGLKPSILNATIPANSTVQSVFSASSDGAGVEGVVNLSGGFVLLYDNPEVGSNSGSVTAPNGYTGSCQAGGGTNAVFTYTIAPA